MIWNCPIQIATGFVGAIILACVAAEFVVRGKGFGKFPLYIADAQSGYRMSSSQHGVFRNRHAWAYDENGMRFEGQFATLAGATVLLGDSIVDGGLSLGQDETLAACLSAVSGETVYPVACPGWALANALGQLTGMMGWQDAKRLLLVINTGDFDTVATAGSQFSFPSRYPRWMVLWLARRHLYRHKPRWWPGNGDSPPPPARCGGSAISQLSAI